LVTHLPEQGVDVPPEDLQALEDLIDAGYLRGKAVFDAGAGSVRGAVLRGATLAGRLFAEEQQEILDDRSLWGRIKSGSGVFIGWLSGLISALIVYYVTK
jgi:hypothetical protein